MRMDNSRLTKRPFNHVHKNKKCSQWVQGINKDTAEMGITVDIIQARTTVRQLIQNSTVSRKKKHKKKVTDIWTEERRKTQKTELLESKERGGKQEFETNALVYVIACDPLLYVPGLEPFYRTTEEDRPNVCCFVYYNLLDFTVLLTTVIFTS